MLYEPYLFDAIAAGFYCAFIEPPGFLAGILKIQIGIIDARSTEQPEGLGNVVVIQPGGFE